MKRKVSGFCSYMPTSYEVSCEARRCSRAVSTGYPAYAATSSSSFTAQGPLRRSRTPEFIPETSPSLTFAASPHITRSCFSYQPRGKVVAGSLMMTSMSIQSSHSALEGGISFRAPRSSASFCQAPGRILGSLVSAIWCSS